MGPRVASRAARLTGRRGARLAKLRSAFERLLLVEPRRREELARSRHARDPGFLADLLRLLPHADTEPGFLAPPPTPRAIPSRSDEPLASPGRILGGRWRIVREVGRGGEGVVWEAHDLRTAGRAAVKILRPAPGRDLPRVRREAATLRWLRLPGVVEIFEDGETDGVVWMATEFVGASAFPGTDRARRWRDIEPAALGLLEALGRVHAAGILHGDLKPTNVLVATNGVVTILDLGLAAVHTDRFARPVAFAGGTPGYVAPECLDGAPPDACSDLHAVGAMLFEALAGRLPGRGDTRECRALPAPPHVRRAIARLLARHPNRRPQSAAETIGLLRRDRRAARRKRWTAASLRARFRGPDLFLHLREDGARLLHARTGGDPVLVEEELASWFRAGLARLEKGLVVTERDALDRIESLPRGIRRTRTRSGAAAEALAHALHAGRPRDVVRAAVRAATMESQAGRSTRALIALEEAAAAARATGDRRSLRRIVRLAVAAAISSAVGRDIDRALWIAERGGEDDAEIRSLADVARAAGEMQRGRPDAAYRIATRITERGPEPARSLAWSVREFAARSLGRSRHRSVVTAGAAWARRTGGATVRARLKSWRAMLAYREGRCAEAMRLHLERARAERDSSMRVRALLDAADAAQDAGLDARAIELAGRAFDLAQPMRRPVSEARAWATLRSARSRRGERLRPDRRAAAASDFLGFALLADAVRFVEAVIAWRRGETETVREILAPAVGRSAHEDLSALRLFCVALDAAAGGRVPPPVAARLARQTVRVAAPGCALQVLALLARAVPSRRTELAGIAGRLDLPRSRAQRRRQREVMSLDEAAELLRLPRPAP